MENKNMVFQIVTTIVLIVLIANFYSLTRRIAMLESENKSIVTSLEINNEVINMLRQHNELSAEHLDLLYERVKDVELINKHQYNDGRMDINYPVDVAGMGGGE